MAALLTPLVSSYAFAKKHDRPSGQVGAFQSRSECRDGEMDCYRFSSEDRDALRDEYQYNWFTAMPNGEHLVRFYQGEQLSFSELRRFRPVPLGYARNVTPPPSEYRLGYYNGMVYAYHPGTGAIADAVDVRH